ncbi:hypothetical protein GCM10010277_81430 [Streptomyces longisporoflavus]|uniref:DUF397 domain-containing protein n=1 Tax=Streptomyces longisporoflavus TaxID=28044 RepID=UPI00167D4E2F|nr:DUF397 domain-containing protein [Streptomyces longisporoflavus]GGV70435.1 hypothetical protein GCM10010277_81430 [Streptomyces longisporoflavus]
MPVEPAAAWQKSSYSSEASSCVYIAPGNTPTTIHLRESDTPEEILTTARPQLAALIAAIKAGAPGVTP